jgi:hypothetical protein
MHCFRYRHYVTPNEPPGQPSKLNDAQRQAIARMIESGPIPAVHGVAPVKDARQWSLG